MATTAVTPLQIWTALRNAGASPIQAAAIMGNMQAESGLNPESGGIDTNGYWAGGLVSWNTVGYKDARSLVTGNPQADLQSQVAYLVKTGGLAAAQGPDPGSAAANFAHSYERCADCGYQGGSSQLTARAGYAQSIYSAATSGNWQNISFNPNGQYVLTSATTSASGGTQTGGASSDCVISAPVVGCLFHRSQLKAMKGGLLVAAGGAVFIVGALVLVAFGFERTGASQAATKALRVTPARPLARGVQRRQAASRRLSEARSREEIRTEGSVTRSEARASAARYRQHPNRRVALAEEPF